MILHAGTDNIISTTPSMVDDAAVDDSEGETCKKNIGQPKRLRRWSRGHQFVVRAGGHIDSWQPLYKYEFLPCINVTMCGYNDHSIIFMQVRIT